MINRRSFLGITVGTGAALAFRPELLFGRDPGGKLIERPIPSSGEMLPVISFAPRPFDGPEPTDGAPLREILETFRAGGGRVVDVLHGGPAAERAARAAAKQLGIQDQFFWTTPMDAFLPVLPGYAGPPPKVDAAAVRAALEMKLAEFGVPKIDLVMVGSSSNVALELEVLREMRREGRVRYIGVHHLAFLPGMPMPPFGELEAAMRSEAIDFIGTDYSAGDRRVEETILPLAQERKIGVMAYFPFDRRRIFQRASSTPLPEWAAEFDATTWAQFFLKYVVSHPAVTMVRTGTTKAAHMLDNLGGGIGRLPDEAMRKRMAELVDSLPPTPPPKPLQKPPRPAPPTVALAADVLDRYVGEYEYAAVGQTVTIRRDGDALRMKISGTLPEGPLIARAETRFEGPFGLMIEFELDDDGRVTGAVVEQGPFRIPLERS